jgi:hypothetical protein
MDGRPAYVTITIYRGVSPDPPVSKFDFDVLSNSVDPNGLPLNPQWSWQLRPENQGKIPDTSRCHDFARRHITSVFLEPSFADCTDQADLGTVDQPMGEPNEHVCKFWNIAGSSFSGHVNWFPVTVEGEARWGDHNDDDDYTFTFTFDGAQCKPPSDPGNVSGNRLSVNNRCGLHVEFDSDETIDHFTTDEWKKLRDAVDAWEEQKNDKVPPNPVAIAAAKAEVQKRFDGHTVLTGMFGLDGEHGGMKAELHPLYAMATRRDNFENNPSDEVWLMFVRNQGDEGYCSSWIWDAGFEDYTVRLPWRPGALSVDVNWDKTNFQLTDGTSGPFIEKVPPLIIEGVQVVQVRVPGVYVTFHLGPPVHDSSAFGRPATIPFIDGALHLIWTGPVASLPLPSPPSAAAVEADEEADEIEHAIGSAIDQLPSSLRQQAKKARAIPGQFGGLPPINGSPAIQKAERDAAQMRALCAATHNAPRGGLPASFCESNVRDHR